LPAICPRPFAEGTRRRPQQSHAAGTRPQRHQMARHSDPRPSRPRRGHFEQRDLYRPDRLQPAPLRQEPETESREARLNDRSEWVVGEAPELRIVDDALWIRVKQRQLEVEASFSHTTTNRLNRAHRPQYVLSGLLECAHCAGPYAIMAKDRSGCTNRKKKLPIDHLGTIVGTNF